jgi:hypothetical protein
MKASNALAKKHSGPANPAHDGSWENPAVPDRGNSNIPQPPRLAQLQSREEYTIAFDSANRDTQTYPESNDFFLPIPIQGVKKNVLQISLGSLELPLAQYTVEAEWRKLYLDEGFPIDIDPANPQVNSEARATITIVSATPGGTRIELKLLARLNPITCVQAAGPNRFGFTTGLFRHALEGLSSWPGPDPIRIIGTTATADVDQILTPQRVEVVNEGFFYATFTTTAPTPGGLTCSPPNLTDPLVVGYVYCPPIATPLALAQYLNGLLRQLEVTVPEASRFSFQLATDGRFVLLDTVPGDIRNWKILVQGIDSLAGQMGFTSTAFLNSSDVSLFLGSFVAPDAFGALVSGSAFQWPTYLSITPANYGPDTLKGETELQLNRYNFDGCCASNPSNASRFTFSDSCGICYTVPIPFGKYVPDVLAAYLQDQMNSLNPSPVPGVRRYSVYYAPQAKEPEHRWIFWTNDGTSFGLEFDAGCGDTTRDIPLRLGFRACSYRGETAYASECVLSSLQVGEGGAELTNNFVPQPETFNIATFSEPRFLTRNYCVGVDVAKRQFSFSSSKPRPNLLHIEGFAPGGWPSYPVGFPGPAWQAVVGPFPQSSPPLRTHSLQAGDVIVVSDPTDPTFKFTSVVSATGRVTAPQILDSGDAGAFLLEVAGGAFSLQVGKDYCYELIGSNVFNLYFQRPFLDCAMRPEIYGFLPSLYLFRNDTNLQIAVDGYSNVDPANAPPDYLLPHKAIVRRGVPRTACDILTVPIQPAFVSNSEFALDGPPYLLMLITQPPGGSTLCQHEWKDSILSQVFAKLVVYPSSPMLRLERVFAMQTRYSSPQGLTGVQLQILNPDHTLYQMHGRNWSGTFVMLIP